MRCKNCYLSQHSVGQVLPKGTINPDIYFIYDEPEDDDLRFGTISNGPRGRYLESFLNSLSISNYRIWSLVRCCAYANETYDKSYDGDVIYPKDVTVRQPNNDEISVCSNYVKMDIKKTNPKVIVPLGGVPLSWLLGKSVKISDYVGRVIDVDIDGVKYKVVPIYSPTYIINNKNNTELLKDFCNYLITAKNVADGTWVDIMSENKLTYALDYASFKEYYVTHLMNKSDCLAYDIETNAELVFDKKFDIIGFSLAKKRDGCYVCMKALDYQMSDTDIDLCKKLLVAILKTTKKVVVHNCLYERPATLYNLGYDFPFEQLDDTLVMAKLMLGGKVGAGLKPNAKRIGYPDWDRDKDNYVDLFTKMLSRLRLKRYSSVIDGFRNNKSLITILDEYKVQGVEKDFGEIFDFYDELRNILLRYYEESEIDNIISKFSEKMLYAFDNGIPSTIPYSWIPYKLLCKYGATDSLATYDLMDYYNKRFDEESTKDVDLHKGYKYDLMEHYAGHNIIMSSLKWDDNAAEKDYENFNKICLESLRYLFNSDKVQEYVYKYHAFDNMTDLVYEYYNDYFWDHFGRRIIQYDETTYKLEMKKDNGSTKKMHIKHLFDDNIYEQLPESIKNDLRSKSMAKINETIKTTNDLEVLKSYFNPASTVAEVTELATAVLVNPELRFRHFLKTIYDEVITNEEFDINNYQEPDKSFLEEYIKYKDIKAENYKDRIDPYNKLMEHFDNISRFNDETLQDLVGKARNWKLDGLDDESQILIYNDMCVGPINPDDPDSWTDLFKWLINLRSYKKSVKIISAYINGKVGRDSVWVVEKKPLEEGSDVVPRIRRYSDCKFVNNRPVLNDNEDFLEQTNFGVCFTGDTKIKCLDGKNYTFKELVDSGVKDLWVYSKLQDGKVVPAKAVNPRVTRYINKLVKVNISNGISIKCTPDHLFMMRDGSYKKAADLKKNDSLMILSIREDPDRYYEYYNEITDTWDKVHIMVNHYCNQDQYDKLLKDPRRETLSPRDAVIQTHHKNTKLLDECKHDNRPECLEFMYRIDHTNYHTSHPFETYNGTERQKEVARKNLIKYRQTEKSHEVSRMNARNNFTPELKHKNGLLVINSLIEHNRTPEGREKLRIASSRSEHVKELRSNYYKWAKTDEAHKLFVKHAEDINTPELREFNRQRMIKSNKDTELNKLRIKRKIGKLVNICLENDGIFNEETYNKYYHRGYIKYDRIYEFFSNKEEVIEYAKNYNHQVISVEEIYLEKEIPVYDLEVPEFHNFALSIDGLNGLFVHNCTAETGRWRSAYHVLPTGSSVKKLYRSRFRGGTILQPDFSANEMRCIASAAHEENMLKAFRDGLDIHRSNAAKIYNVPYDEVTKFQRRFAKTMSFGTLYGMSETSMAYEYFGGDKAKAHEQLTSFYNAFPDLKKWIDARHKECMETGKVSLITQRFINIDFDKNDPASVAQAMRRSQNFPIQGAASDVAAVVFCDIILHQRSLGYKTKPICFIHDSLESDVYPYELLSVIKYQQYELANGAKDYFDLALKADISMGISMGHECELSELEIVDDKETKGYLTIEGWEDEILDTIENWKLAYHKVEIVDRQMEEVYTPMDQMFIPRKAYDPSVMSKRNSGKLKVYIEYYDENGNIDPMAKDISQVNITDLWKNSPLLQYLGK